jgi:hypothetical protein
MKPIAISLLTATATALVVVAVAIGAVELAQWIGVWRGLGLHDEIAKAIADVGTFSVAGVLTYNAWRTRP